MPNPGISADILDIIWNPNVSHRVSYSVEEKVDEKEAESQFFFVLL
jgi:hypothetical protein